MILSKKYVAILLISIVTSVALSFYFICKPILEDKHMTSLQTFAKPVGSQPLEQSTKLYQHQWYAKLEKMDNNSKEEVNEKVNNDLNASITVNVHLTDTNEVKNIPLEEYVLAVTLSELPWSFQDETIKAQMIATRTYIMYRLNANSSSMERQYYDVTDSTLHQVYRDIDESQFNEMELEQLNHFKTLLSETEGKVMTYKDEIIDALYFSTSNGKTESAEFYFGGSYPYLQSVESTWDQAISPSYNKVFTFTYEQFFSRLKAAQLIKKEDTKLSLDVLERSNSQRMTKLQLNGVEIRAKAFREALGLASTDMSWDINSKDKIITIKTKGYGHGVGMSQWGAEGMARAGYTAYDILHHYYTDIEIRSL